MAETMDAALEDLADIFEVLGDWEQRYRFLIDMGRELEPLPAADHIDANKVRGCASQVWITTEREPDGTLRFRADSDAHIVKGLIAVLLKLYSGRTPREITAFDAHAAMQKLGLPEALSSQRANGLNAMIERIRGEARAAA
ncbi:MAG TPA: SufE family protein [Caulobacteraceae bacterium]|jgi:cysteine desulfuration protein SufE|nr:SufE family protein [Caulobacteraceae bacterium]